MYNPLENHSTSFFTLIDKDVKGALILISLTKKLFERLNWGPYGPLYNCTAVDYNLVLFEIKILNILVKNLIEISWIGLWKKNKTFATYYTTNVFLYVFGNGLDFEFYKTFEK